MSFFSDWSVSEDGFNICMTDTNTNIGSTVTVSGGCTAVDECFYSHNYPNDYGNFGNCEITSPVDGTLTVVDFSIEYHASCTWDHLTIGGIDYCGSSGPDGIQVAAGEVMTFMSDPYVTDGGFAICLNTDPTPAPTKAPTPRPTPVPAPIPTVVRGKSDAPADPVPTSAPTRTPIVIVSVGLSGISCSDFDADIYEVGMDLTIGDTATYAESVCTNGDGSSISVSTEVEMDLTIVTAAGRRARTSMLSMRSATARSSRPTS